MNRPAGGDELAGIEFAAVVPQRLRLRAATASQTMSEVGQDLVVMFHKA
jgi:hypothetical protein